MLYIFDRPTQPIMVLFPELIEYTCFTAADRRWKRNITRYENFVENIATQRTDGSGSDLLSILQ